MKICISIGAILCILFSACSKAPEQEIIEARQAFYKAIEAKAEKYAPDELKQAGDVLIEAQSKIDAKDYKSAKELVVKAKEKAECAEEKARQTAKGKKNSG